MQQAKQMGQMEQTGQVGQMGPMEHPAGWGGAERTRVEAVVETLATLRSESESLAEVAHDARNMVTALGLYCDLLVEPGVLAVPFQHYGSELRLVATASRRLVEKLVALDSRETLGSALTGSGARGRGQFPVEDSTGNRSQTARRWDLMPAEPIANLAAELLANRNLLAALAGPSVAITVDAESGAKPVRLTGEDLTRVLVNLVKNAAEAMTTGGRIQIGLHEVAIHDRPVAAGCAEWLSLTIEDNGPGIPQNALNKIFESGYTTRSSGAPSNGTWSTPHRGLGLSITRSIVEAAGGRIQASSRTESGTRIEIDLPVRSR